MILSSFFGGLASGVRIPNFISLGYPLVCAMLFSRFVICMLNSSGAHFSSSAFKSSYLQLLLFFSFVTAFATSFFVERRIYFSWVDAWVNFMKREYILEEFCNQFHLLFLWSNYCSIFVFYDHWLLRFL